HVEAALARRLPIERQHLAADVDNGHHGAARGVERTVPAAACGQAKNSPAAHVAEPAGGVDQLLRLAVVAVARGLRQRIALACEGVPGACVVSEDGLGRFLRHARSDSLPLMGRVREGGLEVVWSTNPLPTKGRGTGGLYLKTLPLVRAQDKTRPR